MPFQTTPRIEPNPASMDGDPLHILLFKVMQLSHDLEKDGYLGQCRFLRDFIGQVEKGTFQNTPDTRRIAQYLLDYDWHDN